MRKTTLRIVFYSTLTAVAATSFGACAGSTKELRSQQSKHEVELAELRRDARRERVKRRDLEKLLALRKAKERKAQNAMVATERPSLPVETLSAEVREPQVLSSEHELPDDYEFMGTNSEGVEIVYVGEAASDNVLKIPPQSFDDPVADDAGYIYDDEPMRPSLRTARAARAARPPLPSADTRLPVTRGVPTIESQLRQARGVVPQSRARGLGDPRAEYKRYYDALRAGNHSYAVTGFRNFVQRFPRHDFADNSQYWLGEAFYDQKRYKSALVEFRKVVDNHPEGNKVPDALLKLGYCYSQTGEVDKARSVWQQIIRVYPKSNPASLAKTKLAEL
ncbi:MAG: tol-pal system protein YbgF [Myxococcales bacterium]|nr:tol-pal system protein YbgF [Myxococcales bacterium]